MLRHVYSAVLVGLLMVAFGGVAGAQGTFEVNTNRPGADISRFLVGPNPLDCQKACVAERRCVAWTYDQRNTACWLKSKVQPPKALSGAISGVVRGAAAPPPPLRPGPAQNAAAAGQPKLSPKCGAMYRQYFSANGTKSFAVSQDGQQCGLSSYASSKSDAIQKAIGLCYSYGGVNCRTLATR